MIIPSLLMEMFADDLSISEDIRNYLIMLINNDNEN
jgi:hypothetical protein